jgi:hypothetical protein
MSGKNEIIDSAVGGDYDLDDLVGDEDAQQGQSNCEQPTEDGDYKKNSCAPFLNEAINRLEEENEELHRELDGYKNVVRGLRSILHSKKQELARTQDVLFFICVALVVSSLLACRVWN